MTAAIVELSNLRFSWAASLPLTVDIPNLQLAKTDRVFVTGASGSGKSTLLSLLAGIVTPQQGSIRILDQDLGKLGGAARDRFRADHIGFIFQMFNLIPYLSVMANVVLPCGFSARRRRNAIQAAGSVEAEALRLLSHLDLADNRTLEQPVTELSVGQQQRVAAARALIGAPELVIADEPTSSLDAERRSAFVDLLFRECTRNGATLIFVSHDTSLAAQFDRRINFVELNRALHSGTARLACEPGCL
ncbi:MAG: ABC transporter ATP-binding protein [Burkholderiales bacterium]